MALMGAAEEIKGRIDLVDLVSTYVPMTKSGRNFKAACPFHNERTPSFYVFPDQQTWHCFGACATGGDIFTFVMKKEGIPFVDALKSLAERAGVELDRRPDRKPGVEDRLRQANEAAEAFYHHTLMQEKAGQGALEYLLGRGFAPETMETFRLGFSRSDWDSLTVHLRAKGYTDDELIAAGLAQRSDRGSVYDRFRGRVMFPIHDERGRITGFGGRAMGDDQPKYLNTPQTSLFDKGGTLYAIHRAREAIRTKGQAVIVEGYTDALMAHQHGYDNVVASMGTAITERQVRILKGLAFNFVLALDPDAAGEEATLRTLEDSWRIFERSTQAKLPGHLLSADQPAVPSLAVLSLPQGRDPDEVILEEPARWGELVQQATPLIDYILQAIAQRVNVSTPQGKARATEAALPIIERMESVWQRDRYMQKLADLLQVSMETLRASIARPLVGTKAAWGKPRPRVDESTFQQVARDPLEEHCLHLLLQHPELRVYAPELQPEHFQRPENHELFLQLLSAPAEGEAFRELPLPLEQHLQHIQSLPLPQTGASALTKALRQCAYRLEERRLKQAMSNLTQGQEPLDSETEEIVRGLDSRLTSIYQEREKVA